MTQAERTLLVAVAKALLELLWWKNVDGRRIGLPIENALKDVAKEQQ